MPRRFDSIWRRDAESEAERQVRSPSSAFFLLNHLGNTSNPVSSNFSVNRSTA